MLLADEMYMEPWDALVNAFAHSHLCRDRENMLELAPDRRERSLREPEQSQTTAAKPIIHQLNSG